MSSGSRATSRTTRKTRSAASASIPPFRTGSSTRSSRGRAGAEGVAMRNATVSRFVGLAIVLIWPAALRANDTMATVGAGGLQFEQTDKIRMEREDLYLSPREVRVSYVFRNLTNQDVRG